MENKLEPMSLDEGKLISHEYPLSLFQKILLTSDGSVTHLLALYAGEKISVRKIEQWIGQGDAPAEMQCPADARLLHRKIMLVDSVRRHVYAESTFVFERFSQSIQAKLLETDIPIGSLWRQEKVEMYREIIDIRIERSAAVAAHFDLAGDALLLSRTYLLHQGGKPLGVITEKFPLASFQS
jgi:chorismate-pyruvate lyase